MENRRIFLNEVALKLNIKNPRDWGKVTANQIYELGGISLLHSRYHGSLFACLRSVFKGNSYYPNLLLETSWKKEWFSNNVAFKYWNSMENRRKFLEEAAHKLNVKTPSDWGKVPVRTIHKLGGRSLLVHYKDSLFACLQEIFKGFYHVDCSQSTLETKWKREWFLNIPRFPKSYWNLEDNCIKFMDEIARANNIQVVTDWRKVTLNLIKNKGGSVSV